MRAKGVRIRARDGEGVVEPAGPAGWPRDFQHLHRGRFRGRGRGLTVAKHATARSPAEAERRCSGSPGGQYRSSPDKVEASLQENGLAFLFAPSFHPAMKHALTPRKEIGVRTVFNLLGPLTNPAGATVHLLGLYRQDLTHPVAEVLKSLGSRAAFVVHGKDHSDEISITGKTTSPSSRRELSRITRSSPSRRV